MATKRLNAATGKRQRTRGNDQDRQVKKIKKTTADAPAALSLEEKQVKLKKSEEALDALLSSKGLPTLTEIGNSLQPPMHEKGLDADIAMWGCDRRMTILKFQLALRGLGD